MEFSITEVTSIIKPFEENTQESPRHACYSSPGICVLGLQGPYDNSIHIGVKSYLQKRQDTTSRCFQLSHLQQSTKVVQNTITGDCKVHTKQVSLCFKLGFAHMTSQTHKKHLSRLLNLLETRRRYCHFLRLGRDESSWLTWEQMQHPRNST